MYSTCTVARAENEELAAWVAVACPELLPSALTHYKSSAEARLPADSGAGARLHSGASGRDAMPVAASIAEAWLPAAGCCADVDYHVPKRTSHMVRFGHPCITEGLEDTISFFCCKFIKKSSDLSAK